MDNCHFYLANGLAPSTHSLLLSTTLIFTFLHLGYFEFMNPSQPLLPASEQTLILFCAHLADLLLHLSIKIYLSAVHLLHITSTMHTCYMFIPQWSPSFLSWQAFLAGTDFTCFLLRGAFGVGSEVLQAWHGGSWRGCQDLPAVGAVSSRSWLTANSGNSGLSGALNLHLVICCC